ncbi:MAG: beta-ketoacyl-[acyl-carrier-protein] synthase family protein [Isosphaeraceae bacterium]
MTAGRPPGPAVVVTGIGLNTALGNGREATWSALRAGRSGCRRLDIPGVSDFVGFVRQNPHPGPRGPLLQAANEAFLDAGLTPGSFDPFRAGCVVGLSKGDLDCLSESHRQFLSGGPSAMTEDWTGGWPAVGSRLVGNCWSLLGPRLTPVAACATGLIAALRGADLIRRGECDVVLAGAGDASLEPLVLGAFRRMGVLAPVRDGDDPARAVRPWDRNRSGFLVGEGGAVLVLEREDHARSRGVLPYCEFAGGLFGADAHHMTDLDPDPTNLAGLIGRALDLSGVEPAGLDHVNVHGTATRSNDPLECQALKLALGEHAGGVSCSASKAQVGHCLGAAGAVELALTCLAVRDQFVPPTLNLDDPDPLCDLDATPHVGRPRPVRAALKLSLGFGGHLAAAVVRQVEGGRPAASQDAPP